MISDDHLVGGFEAAALTEFHHSDHVRLTIVLLARYGREDALQRLLAGIQRLAAADRQPEKFHVTMTHAWLELIEAARAANPRATTPAALVGACPGLLKRDALLRYYSAAVLASPAARLSWVPPDRRPLDSLPDDGPDPEQGAVTP